MKPLFRYMAILTLPLLVAACGGSRFSTYSDYDRTANLRQFDSFAIIDSIQATGAAANPIISNDFNRQRFVDAVRKQLIARGYKEATNGNADLNVSLLLRSRNRTESQYMPGYNPWYGGWWGGGWGNNYTRSYEEVILALNMRQAAGSKLLWQGVVAGDQNAYLKKPDKAIAEAVSELFTTFPAGKRRSYDPMVSRRNE